jgi:hypothetical protein
MERLHGAALRIETDDETGCRYVIWQPMVSIGLGATEREALEDLRHAAHAGIDGSIAEKFRELDQGKPPAT